MIPVTRNVLLICNQKKNHKCKGDLQIKNRFKKKSALSSERQRKQKGVIIERRKRAVLVIK